MGSCSPAAKHGTYEQVHSGMEKWPIICQLYICEQKDAVQNGKPASPDPKSTCFRDHPSWDLGDDMCVMQLACCIQSIRSWPWSWSGFPFRFCGSGSKFPSPNCAGGDGLARCGLPGGTVLKPGSWDASWNPRLVEISWDVMTHFIFSCPNIWFWLFWQLGNKGWIWSA